LHPRTAARNLISHAHRSSISARSALFMVKASSFTESRSVAYSDLHSDGVCTAQGTATGLSTISVRIIGLSAHPPSNAANKTRTASAGVEASLMSDFMNQTSRISEKI
jgi:hypothetical protein